MNLAASFIKGHNVTFRCSCSHRK